MVKSSNNQAGEAAPVRDNAKFLTGFFYLTIGLAASLILALIFYLALRIDSSISSLIDNTSSAPVYLWLYAFFTFGTIILFGFNVVLFVHRFRKFGLPKLRGQASTGLGSLVGVLASACPVCGSTLLSFLGVAGGLSAFPLQGLELKALSFGLMAIPVLLLRRDLKQLECGDAACPVPQDYSFKESDKPWLKVMLALIFATLLVGWNMLRTEPIVARSNYLQSVHASNVDQQLVNQVLTEVLPPEGFPTRIVFGDAILRLLQAGVIDEDKFREIYRQQGGLPPEFKDIFSQPAVAPIKLTRQNAGIYVNLLWPIGLSNRMALNESSPVKGSDLFNFASTGGWNLGQANNGGVYFNKFDIVPLTKEQEELVVKIAKNTYRPCCNNSTFFQDCNHGSALLGLLELGASQGLSEAELYREALAFNSFWFPDTYLQTALYFKLVNNIDWKDIDPKLVMGKDYSSVSGWYKNVSQPFQARGVTLNELGNTGCGV